MVMQMKKKKSVRYIYGKKYPYMSLFHETSGVYVRTGLREDGSGTDKEPFMADFPELLDIGIMGHCIHGRRGLCQQAGTDCYQNGPGMYQEHMALEDFKKIMKECKGRTYQVALGGRGDPDQHPDFADIMAYSRTCGIVPNFTTSGFGITAELADICRQYCGAAAVSWYRGSYTQKAIDLLLQAGVRTNIHYVLNVGTIGEAVRMLKTNGFPTGIHAVVFLLYKPVGLGRKDKVLTVDLPLLKEFFQLADNGRFPYKIGFDACIVPGMINYTHNIEPASLDTCESGRWSAYITPDLYMLPCSFDNQDRRWAVSLKDNTIEEAWNSKAFDRFRSILQSTCPDCDKRENCMGGCPVCPEIVLCGKKA